MRNLSLSELCGAFDDSFGGFVSIVSGAPLVVREVDVPGAAKEIYKSFDKTTRTNL